MSAETAAGDSAALLANVAAAGGDRPAQAPSAAGQLLGRLSVLPALLAMAYLLAGLPLLMLGWFTWPLMLAVSVPLAAAALVTGLRWIPDRWPGALPLHASGPARTPWWAPAGVIAVALAFGAMQMIYHSQQIIIVRDPASYIQFAAWIAHHGSLPIPQSRAAFGGTHHLLTFASPAYYQVGGSIVPQFMAGLPMVLAVGFWAGGVSGAVLLAPVLGAAAVLTFGGLAARLAGPRWAPLAALVLALSLPEQYTSRSTFSEPLAQILFLGGLCLVIDSLTASGTAARVTAGLGGLALGLTILVRIDGISDILVVIPYGGLLLITRRPQAVPLLAGLAVGGLFGVADGLLLSWPYLIHIKSVLLPLALVTSVVVIATAVAVLVLRWRGLPTASWGRMRTRWLLNAAAVAPFAILAGLAVRPYVHPVPVLPGVRPRIRAITFHHYQQLSLHWVVWYLGVPAVALGALGAAVLARRCLRGETPTWTLPLLTFGWIIVTVLYRPAIVPHQPWASRRLVPGVLPGLILLAVCGASWLIAWCRRHDYGPVAAGVIPVCAAALLVPAAMTTFGLGIKDGGPLGIRPVADGWALKATEAGEIAAVRRMCAALPTNSSVVTISGRVSGEFTEVVRGMCGYPTAVLRNPTPTSVAQVVRGIEQAGRRPVLLAGGRSQLTPYGNAMKEIMALDTTQEQGLETRPPWTTAAMHMTVWILEPAS
jgi:hypothetical protein